MRRALRTGWLVGALALAIGASADRARAQGTVRILLAIGLDLGGPEDEPLRYAERDAQRMAQVLTNLGDVDAGRAYVLLGATADQVRTPLARR
jgi:hypothetical protein